MKKQLREQILLKFIPTSLGILYTICLVYIFFFARRRWRLFPERNYNLVPFRDKFHYLQTHPISMSPENLEFYKDLIGNILLFVPLPFLFLYFFKAKKYTRLFLMAVATSLFVEVIQYLFNIGVADVDDLVLNTLGSSIGLLILYSFSRIKTNKVIVSVYR